MCMGHMSSIAPRAFVHLDRRAVGFLGRPSRSFRPPKPYRHHHQHQQPSPNSQQAPFNNAKITTTLLKPTPKHTQLDKEPWAEVRREMTEEKGLKGAVADKIGTFVTYKGPPQELHAKVGWVVGFGFVGWVFVVGWCGARVS